MSVLAMQGPSEWRLLQAVRRALRGRRARLRLMQSMSLAFTAGFGMSPAQAELPVICVSGATCGNSSSVIDRAISSGTSVVASGNAMTVNQTTSNAVLHWQSFNVSSGSSVTFNQPDSSSVALNRIYQNSASEILGNLTANGRIYLINQNGILFGNGAVVNVAGLIASSLDISSYAFDADGNTDLTAAAESQQAAFQLFKDAEGNVLASGNVTVGQGATITTSDGGQVFMFAPNVYNYGAISTPGGQTVLAAGDSVYLASSTDDDLRGILVEVGTGGTVENGVEANAEITDTTQLVGQIIAERGNITLAGAAVNQYGRVTATTSVNEAGSIRLIARDGGSVTSAPGTDPTLGATTGGDLRLGENSLTEVLLDDSGATTVDSSDQPVSSVELEGNKIVMEANAKIVVPHGEVSLTARTDSTLSAEQFSSGNVSDSRIYLAEGAVIDVSGVDIEKSMESNVIEVELRGDELADSDLQRDGALRGETVYIDVRESGTNEDGTEWVGSPIGKLSGWVEGVEKDVYERSLTGGTVTLQSQGEVILDSGSNIDISGGSITYAGGYINTSKVLGADGTVYDIAAADPDREYVGVTSSSTYTVKDPRWGVTRTYTTFGGQGTYEEAYVEGKDAGTVSVSASRIVLNGDVTAETQVGRYQRNLSSEFDVTDSTALYRPYDELPLSGRLILGQTSEQVTATNGYTDYVLSDVRFTDATQTLAADFDPWNDALSADFDALQLSTELFGEDGIGRLTLRANGTVTVAADAAVELPVGGEFDVLAGAIDVAGDVTSHSGNITLVSTGTRALDELEGGLVLRDGATLDVSGLWVNDSALINDGSPGTAALAIDGGSVTLEGEGNSVVLEAGSVVDASGGAHLTADAELRAGKAGSISVSNTHSELGGVTTLALDGELRAYGFDDGGSLSLTTGAVCISDDKESCEEADYEGLLWLKPDFFQQGGFSSYALTTNPRGIELTDGTQVLLRQSNWIADGNLGSIATGTAVDDIADIGLLRDIERNPVDLSLIVTPTLANNTKFNSTTFADAASLTIGTDAAITGDVGASISLSSSSRILVDGVISAAAGIIALRLTNSLEISSDLTHDAYFEDQGIWLGDNAQLLARGAVQTETDDQGRVTGEVLDGGAIAIDADRGHVITSSGSLIDVSGVSAELDVKSDAQGHYQRTSIGSAGGTLEIEASEAIVVGGTIRGESGDPGTVAGGTLSISLDTSSRGDQGAINHGNAMLPTGERTIEVTQDAVAVAFADSTLPESYLGKAAISVEQIEDGGFDAVELSAKTYFPVARDTSNYELGRIEFNGDVQWSLARSLTLDASVLSADGGSVSLSAPVVELGNVSGDETTKTQLQAETVAGTGDLQISAGQVDVVGTSVLQGFAATTLESSGDLRFIGVKNADNDLAGYLTTAGDLTLSAAQVYPTTLTQFTVTAGADTDDGTLSIVQNGEAGDALSAGGALTLTAPNVVQSGTVRAPFGSITIDSPNITLAEGSVTSTSGEGLTVLFGETQGGLDWVYVLGATDIVYGGEGESLPSQQINLLGDDIVLAEGATLDVSGGGDLVAVEFESGTTGTEDVLGENNTSGSFAIVPASSLDSAAYDESIWGESEFEGGKSIYLSGTDDLPAGEYIIVPAKYALLPGAYLVTPVSGYQDITAGESYTLSDGSVVVSGYYTYTGSGLRGSARTSGFAILEGEAVQSKAKYTLTNANDFFAAQNESAATQRLPQDAGTVAITANESLTLEGTLQADAAEGGRGAALDIASSAIEVVADADTAADTEGVLILDAEDLNALGAESILLGGTRSEDEEELDIDTRSATVSIAAGAAVEAPEVMLAATETVTVEQNASITASGAEVQSQDISLSGDGAFVRVATSGAATVQRESAGNAGRVVIADGATLSATGGSISLESSGDAELSGVLAAEGGEVSLTGNLISLGNVGTAVGGWVLDAAQLSRLDTDTLSLKSRSTLDWYGDVELELTNLNLNARALRGYDDGTVSIDAAGDVTVTGGDAASDPADSTVNGQLSMTANNVVFAGGEMELSGFDTVALAADKEIRADDSATLDVVDGDLQLGAQRITTGSGVDFVIAADGAATLSSSGSTETLESVNDLGGSFTLSASAIELATRIELPSGLVTLTATDATNGGITLNSGAAIDVSGRVTEFADELVYSSGGQVSLETASGDLVLAEGSSIDVSAAGGADAGSIELTAAAGNLQVAGELKGSAEAAGAAGSFNADAQNLGDFSALLQDLNAGGFAGDLSFRQRGVGDLTVASGETVQGKSVAVTADQGGITVAGAIVTHDDDGGRIDLSASDGMTISGTLDARATNSEERNGRISLSVSDGGLNVTDSAVIATVADGAAEGTSGDGSVSIRLSQESLLTVIDADSGNDAVRLGGDWRNTADVSIEGFDVYVDADGILDDITVADGSNAVYAAAAAFAAQTDAIAAALSNASIANFDIVTGVEIQSGNSDGSLSLDTDWNLADWRFADSTGALTQTGVLTLRAEGDLTLNQSLSDGFSNADDFTLDLGFGDSWSYNLIAGADTSSADVMATRSVLENTQNTGSVTIVGGDDGDGSTSTADYTVVRTGTGSIDIAAAANIVLTNAAAMIYTAGEASDGLIYNTARGQGNQLGGLYYPTNGGDITLTAGGDIVGGATDQLVTEWLWRIGNTDSDTTRSTAWTVNFAEFHQGVGALAGGDVTVTAGNDIRDLSVSVATIGRQNANDTNDKSANANDLEVIGGGNVSVTAGSDILGGSYYSGRGEIELQAQGEVGESEQNGLAPVLLLGDTQATVTARKDVSIDGVATPTLLPQGSQGTTESTASAFSTYSEDSSLAVTSTAGDIVIETDLDPLASTYYWAAEAVKVALTLLPSTVSVLAQRGDVEFGSSDQSLTLYPDEHGHLDVRAYGDVYFNVIVSDVDPAEIPTADRPASNFADDSISDPEYDALTTWGDGGKNSDLFNADTPVRLAAAEDGTLQSSRIVAANGDVTGRGYFGGPADIYAGQDVRDLDVRIQNLAASDVSTIQAGRDIVYSITRFANGSVLPNEFGIAVDGPGQLLVTAGGELNLNASEGIATSGNLYNEALADEGAGVTVLAGLNGQDPDYATFAERYLENTDTYFDALCDYLEEITGSRPDTQQAAVTAFDGLKNSQRQVFLYRVLIAELRASAEEAASVENSDDYSRGFAALEALFPGSTEENNPYKGDINLYFSRIYTLDGGDINLLAPGGEVNVGLAAPPEGFGITKEPDQLGLVTRNGGDIGIVTDQDVQVNESRIFAVNDSDIVVWSSNGDIDAGRGAKTAISAPTPVIDYDNDGHAYVTYSAALAGSGIQTRATTSDYEPGDVVLAAPRGVVNAGDAGIVAGNLTIAATAVLGADNIKVSGVAVGVPVDAGGLGASLAGVAAAASSASSAAATSVDDTDSREQAAAPVAEAALSWLEVFVVGLGEDACKQDDLECLKRQSPSP